LSVLRSERSTPYNASCQSPEAEAVSTICFSTRGTMRIECATALASSAARRVEKTSESSSHAARIS
jgi:hypothetical protein